MSGRNACVTINGPNRLTSSCSRKSAIGWNSSGPGFTMPALLTRPASPRSPTAAFTVSTAFAMLASSVMSKVTGVRSPDVRDSSA